MKVYIVKTAKRITLDEDEMESIAEARSEGATWKQIARWYGVTAATISKIYRIKLKSE